MTVAIDPSREQKVQDRDLDHGVPLELDTEQCNTVVMTKYINTDKMHADWEPAGEWYEQVVADIGTERRVRLEVSKDGSKERLGDGHGIIVDLVGKMSRVVGILSGRPPLSTEEVDQLQETEPDTTVPMYQQWDFRVTGLKKTCGPEALEMFARSEDQKRQQSEANMFNTVAKAFQEGLKNLYAEGKTNPSPQEVMEASKGTKK